MCAKQSEDISKLRQSTGAQHNDAVLNELQLLATKCNKYLQTKYCNFI